MKMKLRLTALAVTALLSLAACSPAASSSGVSAAASSAAAFASAFEAAFPDLEAVPTAFFVDGNGNIVGEAYVGSRSGDEWATIVDKTLAEVAK